MSEPHLPSGRRGGRTREEEPEQIIDPLTRGESSDRSDAAVELEPVPDQWPAAHEATEFAPVLDAEFELEPDDEESEFEPDFDEEPEFEEESEFEPGVDEQSGFGPGEDLEHGPGHHPGPRLAPGPKHGPGHHPGPPHEHGPGPKKHAPGKKAPAKKAPGKKAPGPKKHPGHRPGPPHEHHPGPEKRPGPKKHPGHGSGPGVEPDFDLGPIGSGFGPAPGFGYGLGFGPGGKRGVGRARRSRPGDVRAAILALLAEGPMHGYEMIQEIAERTQDVWWPSPGSVYPALQLLDDEGLIVGSESEGSRKLFALTDEGRAAAAKIKTPPWEGIGKGINAGQVDLRTALSQLFGAVAQAAQVASAKQQQHVVDIVNSARRKIYSLLSEAE